MPKSAAKLQDLHAVADHNHTSVPGPEDQNSAGRTGEQVRQQAEFGDLPEVEPPDGQGLQARHVAETAEHVRHGRPVTQHPALVQAEVAHRVTQQPTGHRHHRRSTGLVPGRNTSHTQSTDTNVQDIWSRTGWAHNDPST